MTNQSWSDVDHWAFDSADENNRDLVSLEACIYFRLPEVETIWNKLHIIKSNHWRFFTRLLLTEKKISRRQALRYVGTGVV
jgi:hypothetical protein